MVSQTPWGPLVHAQLSPGAGNSGKLVTLVRAEARRLARDQRRPWILADGPPGIGCPVVATLTGASLVVAVTEATVSGEHDVDRALRLAQHFNLPRCVCVNKWDLNPEAAERIERNGLALGASLLPRIPYDPEVTEAQRRGLPVVAHGESPAAAAIRQGWEQLSNYD